MAVGDFKARLRAKFTRRYSATPSASSTDGESQLADSKTNSHSPGPLNSRAGYTKQYSVFGSTILGERKEDAVGETPELAAIQGSSASELELHGNDLQPQQQQPASSTNFLDILITPQHDSSSTAAALLSQQARIETIDEQQQDHGGIVGYGNVKSQSDVRSASLTTFPSQRPPASPRRQSLLPHQQTTLIQALLGADIPPLSHTSLLESLTNNGDSTILPNMVTRKIWVKRPNASATLVTVNEDDLVDDVREMILKKYANSLGRNFDAPDVTLRICPREPRQERTLGPEETMCRTLDTYFPGGQTVDEALIIDVPLRRTPKPSPRSGAPVGYYHEDLRPGETGSDYFPPMPVPIIPSPNLPNNVPVSAINGSATSNHHSNASHAISVLTTGHVPNLPSPGGSRRHYPRPRAARQHASSPTIMSGHIQSSAPSLNNGMHVPSRISRSRTHSSASEKPIAPPAPPLPTPPAQEVSQIQRTATPPPRVSSPRVGNRPKRSKKNSDHPSLPAGLLNGGVPPINVLIVEDNIINLKLLEAFMKRLKVRWQTAMNGKEAVTKWRAGGFHLVLMDIQLPVMNGLEATREIRRLEKLNSIGVFSSSASSSAPERADEPEGDDKLPSSVLFKSPVIIVALTASSLQSDRHEALAAGCNDFLTKVCKSNFYYGLC
jgi:osomolarity two-component system, response regulator SSK1